MYTEDLVVDCCRNRKIIKEVCELLPDRGGSVLPLALGKEPVDLGVLSALMVASEQGHAPRVP